MKENKEILVLNFNELVKYIQEKTEYNKEVIEKVLDLETEYMVQLGIISYE